MMNNNSSRIQQKAGTPSHVLKELTKMAGTLPDSFICSPIYNVDLPTWPLDDDLKTKLHLKALPFYRELAAGTINKTATRAKKVNSEKARIGFEQNAPFGADIFKEEK